MKKLSNPAMISCPARSQGSGKAFTYQYKSCVLHCQLDLRQTQLALGGCLVGTARNHIGAIRPLGIGSSIPTPTRINEICCTREPIHKDELCEPAPITCRPTSDVGLFDPYFASSIFAPDVAESRENRSQKRRKGKEQLFKWSSLRNTIR